MKVIFNIDYVRRISSGVSVNYRATGTYNLPQAIARGMIEQGVAVAAPVKTRKTPKQET